MNDNKEYPLEVITLIQMLSLAANGGYLEVTTRQFAKEALELWDQIR